MDKKAMTYHESILQEIKDKPHKAVVLSTVDKIVTRITSKNLDEIIKAAEFIILNVNGEYGGVKSVVVTQNKCFVAKFTKTKNPSGGYRVKREYASKEMQVYFSSV